MLTPPSYSDYLALAQKVDAQDKIIREQRRQLLHAMLIIAGVTILALIGWSR